MGSCLCLILRCSFRIILILIRYVATISMKAFYDDETLLKIAFKTLLRFLAGINRLSYSVHAECSSRQPTAWLVLLQCTFSWHFKQKVCLIRYRVFRSPVRRTLQVFPVSLYRANREFVYKLFLYADHGDQRGYVKIHLGIKMFVSRQDRLLNLILIGCNIYLRNTREY